MGGRCPAASGSLCSEGFEIPTSLRVLGSDYKSSRTGRAVLKDLECRRAVCRGSDYRSSRTVRLIPRERRPPLFGGIWNPDTTPAAGLGLQILANGVRVVEIDASSHFESPRCGCRSTAPCAALQSLPSFVLRRKSVRWRAAHLAPHRIPRAALSPI